MTFEQILQQKMQNFKDSTTEESPAKHGCTIKILPLQTEIPHQSTRRWKPQNTYLKAPIPPRQETFIAVDKTVKHAPQLTRERLNSAQEIALEIFLKLGAKNLEKGAFCQNELKKSFRSLAKKLHPDTSRSPKNLEAFRQLKMAYDLLTEAFSELDDTESSSEPGCLHQDAA